jgi:hypothetical protein
MRAKSKGFYLQASIYTAFLGKGAILPAQGQKRAKSRAVLCSRFLTSHMPMERGMIVASWKEKAMKLCSTHDQQPFNAELITNHDTHIPGPLAIKRTDNGKIIALREIIGVPDAPGSTTKYQLLEVTPEEKTRLSKTGLTIAESSNDYKEWLRNWNGPK